MYKAFFQSDEGIPGWGHVPSSDPMMLMGVDARHRPVVIVAHTSVAKANFVKAAIRACRPGDVVVVQGIKPNSKPYTQCLVRYFPTSWEAMDDMTVVVAAAPGFSAQYKSVELQAVYRSWSPEQLGRARPERRFDQVAYDWCMSNEFKSATANVVVSVCRWRGLSCLLHHSHCSIATEPTGLRRRCTCCVDPIGSDRLGQNTPHLQR